MSQNQVSGAIRAPKPADPESAFGTKTKAAHAPRPSTPDLDPPGADQLGLSPEEIAQFREQGYIIKRGLIPPEVFEPFHALWWQQPPIVNAGVNENDPRTWVAPGKHWPPDQRWSTADNWMGEGAWPRDEDARRGAEAGERVGRLPHKLTQDIANDVWRWHGIGHDPDFVNATTAHPNVLHMAEALMGGPVKRPHRNRGIYSIFPRDPEGDESNLGPHMDANMTELMVVTYMSRIGPRQGGFTIFPTSPQRLYPTSEQAYNWVATDASRDAMDAIKQDVVPLEFVGEPGDVLFAHALMVHSAGIHEGDNIRMAVIQDMNRSRQRTHMRWTAAGKNGAPRVHCDMDGCFRFPTDNTDDDPADGDREVTNQWIMDSNEFVESRVPPHEDIFAEWNLGREPVTGNVIDEQPWWERYNLPLLPEGDVPRGGGGMPAVSLDSIAEYEGDGVWRVDRHVWEPTYTAG